MNRRNLREQVLDKPRKDYTIKFTKAINIWALQDSQVKALQAGQWVYGGEPNNKGRYLGTKPSGTVIVAWQGNTNQQASKTGYIKSLRAYALI